MSNANNQRIKAQGGMFPTYFKQYQPLDTDITIEAKTDDNGHLRLKSYQIGENKVEFNDAANANVFDEKYVDNVLPNMKVQSDSLVKAQAAAAAAAGAAAAVAPVTVTVPVPVPGDADEAQAAAQAVPVTEPMTVAVPVSVPETGSVPVDGSVTETMGGAKNIFPLSHSKKSRSYKSKTGKKKVIRRNKSRKYRK